MVAVFFNLTSSRKGKHANAAENVKGVLEMSNTNGIDIQQERENLRQASISYQWMRAHMHVFEPNQASAKILEDYIRSNGLEWSVEALDQAFEATKNQLSPPQDTAAQ